MVMRIRELREQRGYSLCGFASELGVAHTVVCNWESEVALPRARQLPDIAKLLNCTIDDLYVEQVRS